MKKFALCTYCLISIVQFSIAQNNRIDSTLFDLVSFDRDSLIEKWQTCSMDFSSQNITRVFVDFQIYDPLLDTLQDERDCFYQFQLYPTKKFKSIHPSDKQRRLVDYISFTFEFNELEDSEKFYKYLKSQTSQFHKSSIKENPISKGWSGFSRIFTFARWKEHSWEMTKEEFKIVCAIKNYSHRRFRSKHTVEFILSRL